MRTFKIIMALVVGVVATSCFKKQVVDCVYTITATQELRAAVGKEPLTTGGAYAFAADTADMDFTNYTWEDAVAGRARMKSGQEITFDVTARAGEAPGQLVFEFTKTPATMVVFDTENPVFAYGQANIVPNLPESFSTLNFPTNKPDTHSVQGMWRIRTEATRIPVQCDFRVVPTGRNAGGALGPMRMAKAYAFFGVDTTQWSVPTSDMAASGRIRLKGGTEERSFDAQTDVLGTDEFLSILLTDEKAMVVVCDQSQHLRWAYTQADLEGNPLQVEEQVLFPTWDSAVSTGQVSEGWTVIYEGAGR